MNQMNLGGAGGTGTAQLKEEEMQKAGKFVTESFLNKNETINVLKIINIEDASLKQKFLSYRDQLSDNKEIIMKLHGTSEGNLSGIKKKGFKIPSQFSRDSNAEGELTFGKAVYFSSYSSKAANYCEGSTPIIIVADVLLGKVKIATSSKPKFTP